MAGGATVGSSRAYRLDPHTLPARGSPIGGNAAATFVIEAERAIVRRAVVAVAVPLDEYLGVSVLIDPIGSDGALRGFV